MLLQEPYISLAGHVSDVPKNRIMGPCFRVDESNVKQRVNSKKNRLQVHNNYSRSLFNLETLVNTSKKNLKAQRRSLGTVTVPIYKRIACTP